MMNEASPSSGDLGTPEAWLRQTLERSGARYTRQRAAVHAFLQSTETHPTAELVFAAVQHDVPNISLATVYKALEVLVEAGLATKISSGDGPARYDRRCDAHCHFRCLTTGRVFDLPLSLDSTVSFVLNEQLIQELRRHGFHVSGQSIELVGNYEPSE